MTAKKKKASKKAQHKRGHTTGPKGLQRLAAINALPKGVVQAATYCRLGKDEHAAHLWEHAQPKREAEILPTLVSGLQPGEAICNRCKIRVDLRVIQQLCFAIDAITQIGMRLNYDGIDD